MELKIFEGRDNYSQSRADNAASVEFIRYYKTSSKKPEDIVSFVPMNVNNELSYVTKLWVLFK